MVNPLLVTPHEFRASPEPELSAICIACGQWEYVKVHYEWLRARLALPPPPAAEGETP